ncbi:hypothetical protein LTR53_003200 [Teratosphaeriaceae sp. CCFEE 6253]|nr:hypothetical protein LTR53_003200 [Teratosphaeriaceae sp. CCFEE 6253]
MKLTSLVLACATTIAARSVFDFDIKFTAYGGPVCTGKVYRVKDLFHNHCWPFAYAESPQSFMYKAKGSHHDDNRHGCQVTVYADENCATEGFSLGGAKSTFRQCGNATFSDGGGEYRSVGVTCGGASLAKPPKFILGTPKVLIMRGMMVIVRVEMVVEEILVAGTVMMEIVTVEIVMAERGMAGMVMMEVAKAESAKAKIATPDLSGGVSDGGDRDGGV